ncbi:agmatine deiminase family protein [Sphingomonas jatrophae]|uniref:Agmatine deiminase n=1 Tax=Sphingomonas jatrophae TaxID=1166337 RepID=A0A1I6L4E0_9SPHN|nr:agmatine deiminase family protein [Sphingomonas jatrophae]SFR98341.1 agmatine deiminase [Sphingomonas jatrophae]
MSIRFPAEWEPHAWVWIGFPSHAELWQEDLDEARAEVVDFARAVHAGGKGEEVVLVAADAEAAVAAEAMAGPGISVELARFGDIWLRDTAPLVVTGEARPIALDFRFNGWGGKYDLPGDDTIGRDLAERRRLPVRAQDWILEGGAIDMDGAGLLVTTEQCLLNPNRNPFLSREQIEERLRATLGIDRVLWLGNGLLNDHTDGHVDNLARFVGPGRIAVPVPTTDDPNEAVYRDAAARARAFGLEVVEMPSPGAVLRDGEIVPASYMNFYIGNSAVVAPLYGAPNDDAALEALRRIFPDRTVAGFRADHVLTGGGSFHCISQQMPAS